MSQPATALEEIRPQVFFVRDIRVRPIIKGEGEFHGTTFHLTSWRRAGMLARLRAQGFVAWTLDEQIAQLPPLPAPTPLGPPCLRTLAARERLSHFDPQALAWATLEPDTSTRTLPLRQGWAIRRRRGRSAPDYSRVVCERGGGAGLLPLDETAALLHGYAQATLEPRAPLALRPVAADPTLVALPALPLPAPHRALLARFATPADEGWHTDAAGLALVKLLFAHLGIHIYNT